MKSRNFLHRLLLVVWLLAFPAAVHAQDFVYSISDGTVTITSYTGAGGAVIIPATIEDLPVTTIGDGAFARVKSLTSVTIPDSVTSIAGGAFRSCTSLTSVTIGNGVTSIGDHVFDGCTSLTSVTIGNGVTSIGDYVFWECANLTNITIPNSVTSIGFRAFLHCTSLTSVTIGSGVTSIGKGAFSGCTSLTAIAVDEGNSTYSSVDGILFDKIQTMLIRYPIGKAGAYTIPDSVTGIGERAFKDCSSLTSVTIPDSVTSIGDYVFSDCTSLTSITIPDSVTSIGESAFFDCTSLTTVTVPASVSSIGKGAFSGRTGLTAFTVDAANPVYSSLDGIVFDKSQTTLVQYPGGKAGAYTIPDGVTSIGDGAFSWCSSLTDVTIPDSVTSIGENAFSWCTSLTSLTIPARVTEIGNGVFGACTSLTAVTIPDSVTSIGRDAFTWCFSLTSVTIPDSVTEIGFSAFWECTSLTSVYFEGNAPKPGELMFYGTDNLTVYYLPGKTGWGTTYGGRPTVLIGAQFGDFTYVAYDTYIEITDYPDDATGDVIIPSAIDGKPVTSIASDTFNSCTYLTSITIPARVTSIGSLAFVRCSSLNAIYFEGNAPSEGWRMFAGADKATVYYLPGTTGWSQIYGGRPAEQAPLGGTPVDGLEGWFYSEWFGFYATTLAPWLFHAEHGFIYRYPESTNSNLYFYDDVMTTWWWTSESDYSYIYVFDPPADRVGTDVESCWLWYFGLWDLGGSPEPRAFGVVTGSDVSELLFFGP